MQVTRQIIDSGFAKTAPRKPFFLRLLDRVIRADAQYRDRQRLRRMPEDRLKDIGLDRGNRDDDTTELSNAIRFGW